jgi:thymidine phosphorylase
MQAIIQVQGAKPAVLVPGKLQQRVLAKNSGYVAEIDNFQLSHIARLAGAPIDQEAGVDLHKKRGDAVAAGDTLYTIHAVFKADFTFAVDAAGKNSGYQINVNP